MKRVAILLFFAILIASGFIIVRISLMVDAEGADISNDQPILKGEEISNEKQTFSREDFAYKYKEMPENKAYARSLETYYNNRAFHGAPPYIPHPVEDQMDMGGKACLKCHENGGFVDKWKAYTPVVPHPEKVNCRQCHVPQETGSMFKTTGFVKKEAPSVGNNNALPGSPPYIPHQLQLHENCLACHAGPAAPKEIRVTHPERINCRQCHVLNELAPTELKSFTRTKPADHD